MIGINVALSIFCFLLIYVENRMAFQALREFGEAAHLPSTQPYFKFLELQSGVFSRHLAFALLIGTVISVIATLLYSHKVAGPMVRLKRFFQNIGATQHYSGEKLSFRKGDYFEDLPTAVNEALEVINKS